MLSFNYCRLVIGGFQVFIHAVPDNRGKKDGYFCSLVESTRIEGKPTHKIILSFGFIASERLPYLKAAFNRGDPETILLNEKRRLENRRKGQDDEQSE